MSFIFSIKVGKMTCVRQHTAFHRSCAKCFNFSVIAGRFCGNRTTMAQETHIMIFNPHSVQYASKIWSILVVLRYFSNRHQILTSFLNYVYLC